MGVDSCFFPTGAMLTEGVRLAPGFLTAIKLLGCFERGTELLGTLISSNGLFDNLVIGLVCPFGNFTSTVLPILVPEGP